MGGKQSIFAKARDGDLHGLKMCVEQLDKDKVRRLTSVRYNDGYTKFTPLVIACRNGHVEVVEYLIDECGADIELKGSIKNGPRLWAADAPLLWASARGHLNVVKCLLSRGANVNSVGASDESALHKACWNGHLEVVEYLIANGADVEAVNINGATCLVMACHEEHYQIVMYLLQKDVNGRLTLKSLCSLVDVFTEMHSEGKSVDFKVIMAVFKLALNAIEAKMKCSGSHEELQDDNIEILSLFGCMARMQPEMCEEQNKSFREVVRRYVSVSRDEEEGWTPLHSICFSHEWCLSPVVDVVRLLLDAGADPQAVDNDLDTPLHCVAMARPVSFDLVRLLLDRGAHFDARNADGECFLDLLAPKDRDQFNSVQYTTLQCLAAQSLMKSNIPYKDYLPRSLVNFVKLH